MKPNEQADANVIVNPDNNWQQQVIFFLNFDIYTKIYNQNGH
jgi:hypothetical protein